MTTSGSQWEVTWLSVCEHWDWHRDGWLRCGPRNRYFYFESEPEEWVPGKPSEEDPEGEDGHWNVVWRVYEAPADIAIPHLQRVRQFRSMVWWGWSYDPRIGDRHEQHPGGYRGKKGKASFDAFYALPRLPDVDTTRCRLIGVTTNLRTIDLVEHAQVAVE